MNFLETKENSRISADVIVIAA